MDLHRTFERSKLIRTDIEHAAALEMSRRLPILLGVALIFIVSATSIYLTVNEKPPAQEKTVRVVMTTFNWGFNVTNIQNFQFGRIYPNPIITVHRGQRAVIELRALDSTHGFAIDEFGIQAYIPPGQTVTVSFVADRVGNFTYYCNVFCGIGHPSMHGILQVLQ